MEIVAIFFACTTTTNEVTLSQDHSHYKRIDPQNYKEEGVYENLYDVFTAYLQHL